MKLQYQIAIFVTVCAILLIIWGWLNFLPYTIEANDIGEYFGGVFSPLAFLWLVLGYELQRKELALTRDQMKAQAVELERQASASIKMLDLQIKSLQREEIRDKSESLPQRVAKLISCYRPLHEAALQAQGAKKFMAPPNQPKDQEPASLKKFSNQLLSIVTAWNQNHQENLGPLPEAYRALHYEAFARLELEYEKLSDWWFTCRQLSRDSGMEALATLGEQFGMEELLKATSMSVGKTYGRMEATLQPVTLTAAGTVN